MNSIDPPPKNYLTKTLFIMPTATGGTRAIAVSITEFQYLNATYTLLITAVFGLAWQLIVYIALMFYPTEHRGRVKGQQKDGMAYMYCDPTTLSPETMESLLEVRKRKANRYVALVAIWNAGNPWSAIMFLYAHAFNMFFRADQRLTGVFDVLFIIVAFVTGVATFAAGILVPPSLGIGSVAPVNPESVFFAIPSGLGEAIRVQQTRAPAALRSIGIVETTRDQLRKNVNIHSQVMDWTGPGGESVERTAYSYNVTGLDFGLQYMNSVNFVMRIEGACTFEYGWFNTSMSSSSFDVYDVFGLQVHIARMGVARSVGGRIEMDIAADATNGNVSYAILPDTVDRASFYPGRDPWYNTTATPTTCTGCPGFKVANARPALSCWQKDTWSYNGHTTHSISDLRSLPGLDLPAVIRDEFIPAHLASPMISNLASSLGDSILISSSGSIRGIFDASKSNHSADFERLILASFVASQNILRDTTMTIDTYDLRNSARGLSDSMPKLGVGNFVVNSAGVVTLSLPVLIGIPLLWAFLCTARACFRITICTTRNSGLLSRLALRAYGLQAVQLYRMLDEEVCGDRDDWHGRNGQIPYVGKAHPVSLRVSRYARAAGIPPVTEITPPTEIPPVQKPPFPTHALFAAPKVQPRADGRYHLKFSGPVDYEPPWPIWKNQSWQWGRVRWAWWQQEIVASGPRS